MIIIPSEVEFGTIVYDQPGDGYTEFVVASNSGVRVIACLKNESNLLYRIEYTQRDGTKDHAVLYTLRSAILVYRAMVDVYGQGA